MLRFAKVRLVFLNCKISSVGLMNLKHFNIKYKENQNIFFCIAIKSPAHWVTLLSLNVLPCTFFKVLM